MWVANPTWGSPKIVLELKKLGIDVAKSTVEVTAPVSPWQNACAERLIGSIRHELLDLVIVLDGRHLTRLLKRSVAYYNRWRTHRSREGNAPDMRPVRPAAPARTVAIPEVQGLHHYYLTKAAWVFGTHKLRPPLSGIHGARLMRR
jgi:hypothetical protein